MKELLNKIKEQGKRVIDSAAKMSKSALQCIKNTINNKYVKLALIGTSALLDGIAMLNVVTTGIITIPIAATVVAVSLALAEDLPHHKNNIRGYIESITEAFASSMLPGVALALIASALNYAVVAGMLTASIATPTALMVGTLLAVGVITNDVISAEDLFSLKEMTSFNAIGKKIKTIIIDGDKEDLNDFMRPFANGKPIPAAILDFSSAEDYNQLRKTFNNYSY